MQDNEIRCACSSPRCIDLPDPPATTQTATHRLQGRMQDNGIRCACSSPNCRDLPDPPATAATPTRRLQERTPDDRMLCATSHPIFAAPSDPPQSRVHGWSLGHSASASINDCCPLASWDQVFPMAVMAAHHRSLVFTQENLSDEGHLGTGKTGTGLGQHRPSKFFQAQQPGICSSS